MHDAQRKEAGSFVQKTFLGEQSVFNNCVGNYVCVCVCLCQSVCGGTDWLSYGQTFFMVGMLLGSLVVGAISDR